MCLPLHVCGPGFIALPTHACVRELDACARTEQDGYSERESGREIESARQGHHDELGNTLMHMSSHKTKERFQQPCTLVEAARLGPRLHCERCHDLFFYTRPCSGHPIRGLVVLEVPREDIATHSMDRPWPVLVQPDM